MVEIKKARNEENKIIIKSWVLYSSSNSLTIYFYFRLVKNVFPVFVITIVMQVNLNNVKKWG